MLLLPQNNVKFQENFLNSNRFSFFIKGVDLMFFMMDRPSRESVTLALQGLNRISSGNS